MIKDDTANPDVGRKLSLELVDEKVVAVIGFCNTGVALKSLDVFQDNKLPLLIPCTTGSPLTAKYPGPESYIFRTSAKDGIQAPFVVDDILKRGWKKVAIFADSTPYGEGGMKDVVAALEARNIKPVYIARFPLGVKDLTEELKAARAEGIDVVFSYTVGPESAVIARGRKELGWKVPQVGAWSLSLPNFINGAKDAAEGALMAQTFIAEPSNERRATFLAAYSRKYKVQQMPVPMAVAQAYDTTYLLAFSFFDIRDGNLTGPAIKQQLENKKRTFYGVVATYQRPFSIQDKDAVSTNMLVMGKIKDGLVTFAYPEDAKRNLFVQRKQ